MEKLIFGLLGCFFGMSAVIVGGSVVACLRGLRRVALHAALTALLSAFHGITFLGGFAVGNSHTLARFMAHLPKLFAGFLTCQLLMALSFLRTPDTKQHAACTLADLCFAGLAVGGALPEAIAGALRMPRTAVSYAIKVAWFDHTSAKPVDC